MTSRWPCKEGHESLLLGTPTGPRRRFYIPNIIQTVLNAGHPTIKAAANSIFVLVIMFSPFFVCWLRVSMGQGLKKVINQKDDSYLTKRLISRREVL